MNPTFSGENVLRHKRRNHLRSFINLMDVPGRSVTDCIGVEVP
jgi:hypothetical protein